MKKTPIIKKPSPKLAALLAALDDDAPAKPKKAKDSSFWDTDPVPAGTKPALPARKTVKSDPPAPPPPLAARFQQAVAPKGFFALQCGEDRVTIMYGDALWKDLLCWHHRMETTVHLKREDLLPKDAVDAACHFLQSLR